MRDAVVKSVVPYSIAYDAGIESGDIIQKIDGKDIIDILDYKYLTSSDYYIVTVKKKEGETEEIEVYNDEFEEFGVEFVHQLIDEPKMCRNKCIFCFMDQLPPNMRSTMYFKDDDVRLSFLQGNYVTLTNLSDKDIERIISLKISPINVSVHVTDGETRKKMLNNRFADKVLDIMTAFAKGGIKMNAQIVLCRNVNDGVLLEKTITDLRKLYPAILSISIVPVGVSRHRAGLFKLESFDEKSSGDVIDLVTSYQKKFKKEIGTSLVYLADEFYIQAKRDLPPFSHYETFPQIENGVGLMTSFMKEFYDYIKTLEKSDKKIEPKTLVTSYIAYDYFVKFTNELKKIYKNLDVSVVKIRNDFFGEKITVTGLICGSDIINQLKGQKHHKKLVLCDVMIKDGTELFLDDTTISDVEKELDVKIMLTKNDGYDFTDCICDIDY